MKRKATIFTACAASLATCGGSAALVEGTGPSSGADPATVTTPAVARMARTANRAASVARAHHPLVVNEIAAFKDQAGLRAYARHLCSVQPVRPNGTPDVVLQSRLRAQCETMFSAPRTSGPLQQDGLMEEMMVMAEVAPPPPPPPPPEAAGAAPPPLLERAVEVQAPTDAASAAASTDGEAITNTQVRGVDEGGIVKKVGPYILTLMDGRIFSVDTRGGELKLVDRQNVYRHSFDHDWYDEMLVDGDQVIVTAYSYQRSATELSVFAINPETGKVTPQGVFYLPSNDYYSTENYATRIVNGRLVVRTTYPLEAMVDTNRTPKLDNGHFQSRPLVPASMIHWPVLETLFPVVHTLITCDLDNSGSNRDLDCSAQGFVGPQQAEMLVTPDDIFLTLSTESRPWWQDDTTGAASGRCGPDRPDRDRVAESVIYKVPVDGGQPEMVIANGAPFNQFSMEADAGSLHMLTRWATEGCGFDDGRPADVTLVSLPFSRFSDQRRRAPDGAFIPLPRPLENSVVNRFAHGWLVYGSTENPWTTDGRERGNPSSQTWATRLATGATHRVDLGHSVVRIEPVARGMMINGYAASPSLTMSFVDFKTGVPVKASSLQLNGMAESEGRSHAFNSLADPDGGALIGLPTVRVGDRYDQGRVPWRSTGSDMSYITLSPTGTLTATGQLRAAPEEARKGYRCEVSCVDWYGNARALFFDRRILALMGTEIVEGQKRDGQVRAVNRLDLTGPVTP
jgi:hypothetical protein